jgi:hypothetical protein
VANAPIGLVVTKAKPGAPLMLVVGGENLGFYFQGRRARPAPGLPALLHGAGQRHAAAAVALAARMPAGFPVLFQAWIQDAAAVYGWAGTNGLAATGP